MLKGTFHEKTLNELHKCLQRMNIFNQCLGIRISISKPFRTKCRVFDFLSTGICSEKIRFPIKKNSGKDSVVYNSRNLAQFISFFVNK